MGYFLLAVIAAAGLLVSIVCHLMGWLGVEPPGGKSLFVMLNLGIFVVCIPLGILADRTKPKSGRDNFKHLLAELPKWARVAAVGLLIYAILNYVSIMIRHEWRGISFSLKLRAFSGHWMLFYGWAAAGFVALARLARKRRK